MSGFRNAVPGFGLVLLDRKGAHRKSWWREIARTGREFPVARGQIFYDSPGYQLPNLNGILTFVCYTDYRVGISRQLFGLPPPEAMLWRETKNPAARLVWWLGETGNYQNARNQRGNQNRTARWLKGGDKQGF